MFMKRFLGILLSIALVIQLFPADCFYSKVYAAENDEPRVWIEGYADGSVSGFRSSQMLVVKTSGFADNAKLSYHYYNAGPSKIFSGYLFVFSDGLKHITNMITGGSECSSSSPYFAVQGKNFEKGMKVVVKDINLDSVTYGKSVEASIKSFAKSNLSKDLNVGYAMFAGETKPIKELLAETGIGHITGDHCATIKNLSFTNVDSGTITSSSDNVTALNVGLAKMKISVSKADSCYFQPGQSASGECYIKVFDKVTVTAVEDGFDLTNTQKNVTYTIGNKSIVCNEDGQTLSFRGFGSEEEYEVICSAQLPDGKTAKKSVSAKTLKIEPFHVYFDLAEYPGATNIPATQDKKRYIFEKAVRPTAKPYAPGYVFDEWYADNEYAEPYDFNSLVMSDVYISGKWNKLKHTAVLNLTLDGNVYSGNKVELYQNNRKKYELFETSVAGKYQLENVVETGEYDIFVNGSDILTTFNVTGKKTEKDLTATELSSMVSNETATINVNLISLQTTCLLDGEPANIGDIFYRDNMGEKLPAVFADEGGNRYYYAPASPIDTKIRDIFVNGADADRTGQADPSKDISVSSPDKILEFYSMSFDVKIDDSTWTSDNVVLRDDDGNFVTNLVPAEYDTVNGVRSYSAVMLKDEATVPKNYNIYLDEADTKLVLTATEGGSKASASAYTASVTLTRDNALWNDAKLNIFNDKYSYSLFKGDSGVYKTALIFDENDEMEYTVSVNGAIENTVEVLNSTGTQAALDYYTVDYYSYKEGVNPGSYELNTTPYRKQTVRENSKAMKVADPYVPGLTFSCFGKEQWQLNGSGGIAYDFDEGVTQPLSLYAHFVNPEININGFVKSDDSGAISPTGTYFTLPNLTISGFDEGEAIKSILITVSNAENVSFPSKDGVTVNSKDGTHAITFAEKVSMAEAQVYLRTAVFKPVQEKEINLSITVSDGVIDASSETSFTQTQITENWIKLSSVSGYNTRETKGLDLSAGNYYVDESVTITNNSTGGSGLRINGNVNLYIPKDVVLTANGAAGSGKTGGGAGVYLPSGKNLYLYGEGTLNANGGKAGDGEKGENGENSYFVKDPPVYYTKSGKGGNGGGGAGAGIGTNGATGANGADAVGTYSSSYNGTTGAYVSNDFHTDGINGNPGNDGKQAADSGIVYTNGVTINANGGGAGNSVSGQSSAGSKAYQQWGNYYTVGASGGGGNGASGKAGNKIGPGGSSGGSGGSGGSGAVLYSTGSTKFDTVGGRGGNAAGTGAAGTSISGSKYSNKAGDGGDGGTNPATKSPKSAENGGPLDGYTVTFAGAQGNPAPTAYALNSKNVVVNVPDYTPESGKFFLGWRVSTYGKNVNGQSETKPLTTAETQLYQPGESITLAELTYGNIELKPVTIEIAGKTDTDTLFIPDTVFVPSAQPVNYYNYSVNTTLNGTAADIGAIVLKPETGDDIILGGNGSGTYSLTNEDDTTYRIYVDNEDSGVSVTAGTPAEIQARLITVTTNLNGSPSAVPGDVILVLNQDMISTAPVLSNGELSGTYKVRKLIKDMPDGTEYSVYVGGVNSGMTVKPGESLTIDYSMVRITVTGNAVAENVVLKNETKGNIIPDNTASGVFSSFGIFDDTAHYDIYINGQPTGRTVKFNDTENTAEIEGHVLTLYVRVDGIESDATGAVPEYKSASMQKKGTGTYSAVDFSDVQKARLDGKELEFLNNEAFIDYYTVRYDANGSDDGTAPVDGVYYPGGSTPQVIARNDLLKTDCLLLGWSLNGTVYKGGDTLPAINSAVILTAEWKQTSEYPLVIVVDGEVIYAYPEQLKEILDERDYPAQGDGKPQIIIEIRGDSSTSPMAPVVLPEGIYLGPEDRLVVKDGVTVELLDNFTNEGEILVEENSQIIVDGLFENKGRLKIEENSVITFDTDSKIINDGKVENYGEISLKAGAGFKNNEDGLAENFGVINVESGAEITNAGEFVNKDNAELNVNAPDGSFTNTEIGTYENYGTNEVNGMLENAGEVINRGRIYTTTQPGGTLKNEGSVDGTGGGILALPIDNEGGVIRGGMLENPGSIDGGSIIGLDTSAVSPDAVRNVEDFDKTVSDTPAQGGELPGLSSGNSLGSEIDAIFGTGNATLALDSQGEPRLDENGGYIVIINNTVELENPLVIPDGVKLTIDLQGNAIVGPDGENAIEMSDSTLILTDSVGGGRVCGGMGTTENGGTGDGGDGVTVSGNGKLKVDSDVEVKGGPGVGSGNGGYGVEVDLDPNGTGNVYINGTLTGGDGGSDTDGLPGDGGSGINIISAPDGSVVFGIKSEVTGGDGGMNIEGEKGTDGTDAEISSAAENALHRERVDSYAISSDGKSMDLYSLEAGKPAGTDPVLVGTLTLSAESRKYTGDEITIGDAGNIPANDIQITDFDILGKYYPGMSVEYVGRDGTADPADNAAPATVGKYTVRIWPDKDTAPDRYLYADFNIEKATPTTSKAPIGATGLVYDGKAKNLLTVLPESNLGTLSYAVSQTEGTEPDVSEFAAAAPTAVNAGTHYVYYMITPLDENNYSPAVYGPVEVSVEKKAQYVEAPQVKEIQATTVELIPVIGIGTTAYAAVKTDTPPADDTAWQESVIFTGLVPDTTYYFFARCSGDTNNAQGVSEGTDALTLRHIKRDIIGIEAAKNINTDGIVYGTQITIEKLFSGTPALSGTDEKPENVYMFEGTDGTAYPESRISPTDAGNYKLIIVSVSDNYDGLLEIPFKIVRATPDAPAAGAVGPMSGTDSDGWITGVDETMEYAVFDVISGEYGDYRDVTGSMIKGLVPGTRVRVRLKETANFNAGKEKELVIPSYMPPTPDEPKDMFTVPVRADNAVRVEASINSSNADLTEITAEVIDEIFGEAAKTTTTMATIDLSDAGCEINSATISRSSMKNFENAMKDKSSSLKTVEFMFSNSKIVLDEKTVSSIIRQASGERIRLVVDDVADTEMNVKQKSVLGDRNVLYLFEAYIESNGIRIHDFEGGKIEVIIEYECKPGTREEDYKIYYLADNGLMEEQKTEYKSGAFKFITGHFSEFVLIYNPDKEKEAEKEKPDDNSHESKAAAAPTKAQIRKNSLKLNKEFKLVSTEQGAEVEWGRVPDADGYLVYASYCGEKAKKVATLKGNEKLGFRIEKLNGNPVNLKKNVKVIVKAYRIIDGKKTVIAKSVYGHIAGCRSAKYTNASGIRLTGGSKYVLKVGEASVITAKIKLADTSKKQLSDKHTAEFRYISSNEKIAEVGKDGTILAKKAGKCSVYVYARNGFARKITVVVED